MLKDKAKKEYQKEYMRKKRSNKTDDVRPTNVRPLLHRPNGPDYNPEEMLGGRKRYLGPFTDGQVLDRLSVPSYPMSMRRGNEIIMSNRANEYRSESTSPEIAKRLKELMKQ